MTDTAHIIAVLRRRSTNNAAYDHTRRTATALADLAESVLSRHDEGPAFHADIDGGWVTSSCICGTPWPCPDYQAVFAALDSLGLATEVSDG